MNKFFKSIDKRLFFILSFLFIFCVAFSVVAIVRESISAYSLAGIALALFVGIFTVGVLDYKIGGSYLTLEKRVNTLEQENKELREVVNALLKSLYVISYGPEGYGGPGAHHFDLVQEYMKPIASLLEPDLAKHVEEDMEKRRWTKPPSEQGIAGDRRPRGT